MTDSSAGGSGPGDGSSGTLTRSERSPIAALVTELLEHVTM